MSSTATARSHPNIAVIKYWGKRNTVLNLPAVPSVSLTLSKFHTTTTVTWGTSQDSFTLNGNTATTRDARKVFNFLDLIDQNRPPCKVVSENNFPTAAGLASSSSAFSALAMAGLSASENSIDAVKCSILARQGSGSASRSLWGGWVHWTMGVMDNGLDCHGIPIAGREHWDLCMVMAVVSDQQKPISSRAGMLDTATTSPMYQSWCDTAQQDVDIAIRAILDKDLSALGRQMEVSTLKMFATMFTTIPSIRYWKSKTIDIIELVERLRERGTACWYTMDAGPNVKILCHRKDAEYIASNIQPFVKQTHILEPGRGTHLL